VNGRDDTWCIRLLRDGSSDDIKSGSRLIWELTAPKASQPTSNTGRETHHGI